MQYLRSLSEKDIQYTDKNTNIYSQPLVTNQNIDLKKLNQTLPDDILRTIYDNYLLPEIMYNQLQVILHSKDSQRLNSIELSDYLENVVFTEPIFIEKLQRENAVFANIYQTEIIQNQRTFKNMTNIYQNFAMCWLFHLYH